MPDTSRQSRSVKKKPTRRKSLKLRPFQQIPFQTRLVQSMPFYLTKQNAAAIRNVGADLLKGDLKMYRKLFAGILGLTLFGATFLVPKAQADESDMKTIMTVNEPIQVPGKVLPAGTYVLKLLLPNDRTLVAIYNADETHLITTVQGIPDSRIGYSGKVLQVEDQPEGPEALKAWFYPGYDSGVQFVYPNQK
jgi:hypothetical protein